MRRPTFILPTLLMMICAGCLTGPPLPPANFSAPGWGVQQGQAIWKPSPHRPEIAGDLLLATNADGNFFIQFSKMPFPVVTAQVAGDQWQIEFGADKYSWHGHGPPPQRFGWFQLPGALAGGKTAGNWHWENGTTNFWRLNNPRSGEILEGEFFP